MTTMPFGDMPRGLQFDLPTRKPGGGMFGGTPNWVNAVQAAVGGYLQGRGMPGGSSLLDQVHQRQMMAQQQAMMQQQRQADMEDFEKKQQIELRYRPPAQPTEYERLLQAMGVQPGTADYQEHVGRYVGAKENPIVMTPYGPMPYSAVTGQQATRPVGKLTPIDDGGPTAPPSAMFPRPF